MLSWLLWVVVVLAIIAYWRYGPHSLGPAASPPTAAADFSMLPSEFVVFDLETTGLNPQRNKIIEIGAVLMRRDDLSAGPAVTATTFQALVKITSKVPKSITSLTGITDTMLLADGVPLAEALAGFQAFIGDRRLVAYNAAFDLGFLNAALGAGVLRNSTSCALDMARRAFPGQKNYRLADLARSVDAGGSHRALADCHRAVIVYVSAAQQLKSHR